ALLVAKANVDSAKAEVDKAVVEIRSAEANVESAKALIESAEVQVENNIVQVESAKVTLKSTLVKIKNAQNDVTTAQNSIASDKANLAGATAQLNLAKQNLDREQKGVRDETSTVADLDEAQANYDVQKANVSVAESKLATAKNNLSIAETQVEMAENDRDIAQSKVAIAESELKISRTKVTVAKTDLVNAIAKVDNAKTAKSIADKQVLIALEQVKKQEAVLAAARERHSYTIIKAEWAKNDGSGKRFVSERYADPGALLAVNSPIISIIDNAKLKVAVTAIEKDFARLQVGQKATVYVQVSQDGDPLSKDNEFQGTIIRKSPVIDDVSRQGRFEIEIDNADGRLHPGAFARIEIVFSRHEDCIILPEDAVVQRNDSNGVFISNMKDGQLTAVFIPVNIGIIYKHKMEIIPVKPEDRSRLLKASIITMGNHLLKDGSAIRLPDEVKTK
ncbi:MAG: efflux RND transporter periplasmic adaptor subunit, partial [Victivallales bacterium]|nr:efflux RND transporter periplasmic adaptor subunit [Victivallales bacterium]